MASIAFAGVYAGTVIAMPASGILSVAYGWESVFYVFGGIGVFWLVIWLILVRRCPEEDPWISEEEKNYIVKKIGLRTDQKINPPWKAIFTSAPVWAIVSSHCAENWGFYTLLTQLPTFLSGEFQIKIKIYRKIIIWQFLDVFSYKLEKTGFLSAGK